MKGPVVVIANGLMNAGGTESLLMELFRHSSGAMRYILLVHHAGAQTEGSYDAEIRRLGVQMEHIPSVGTLGIKGYVAEFMRFKERIGHVDIIHSHLNANGGIISMAARKAGIPVRICHCHADIKFRGSLLSRLKEELALGVLKLFIHRYATDAWACSAPAWRRLYFPGKERVIINNTISPEPYFHNPDLATDARKALGLEGKYIIGSVGRVAPIKNYERIIELLPALPDAVFVCYGRFDEANAYCSKLSTMARDLGVAHRVHFMGNTDNVPEALQLFDLFVMPSFTEGFGMAALEAQSAGLHCLLSSGIPPTVDLGLGLVEHIAPMDAEAWLTAVTARMKATESRPTNAQIMDAFRAKGLDAASGIKNIEERYIHLWQSRTNS